MYNKMLLPIFSSMLEFNNGSFSVAGHGRKLFLIPAANGRVWRERQTMAYRIRVEREETEIKVEEWIEAVNSTQGSRISNLKKK